MAWRKAKDNSPAVGQPVLTGGEEQIWRDSDGDVVFASSPNDFPQAAPQASFMGIPVAQPTEGSTHSILLKIASDIAAIKSRLGI